MTIKPKYFIKYDERGIIINLAEENKEEATYVCLQIKHCDLCGEKFTNIYDIYAILKNNEEPIYICPKCGGIGLDQKINDIYTTL